MHISYKPLWHTLLERDMRKEDLRLAAGMTTNTSQHEQRGKAQCMDTLARICEILNCEITDGISRVSNCDDCFHRGMNMSELNKNNGKRN